MDICLFVFFFITLHPNIVLVYVHAYTEELRD